MTHKAISGRIGRAGRGRCSRLLRVVLVLSLWHAPIPWIHAHDLQGPAVDSREVLSQHVAEFHGRELSLGQTRLDWHLHLVLPWCLAHYFPCPDEHSQRASDDLFDGSKVCTSRTVSPVALGQPATRAFLADECTLAAGPALLSAAALQAGFCALDRGRHFLETYGCAVGAQELIGVRLC